MLSITQFNSGDICCRGCGLSTTTQERTTGQCGVYKTARVQTNCANSNEDFSPSVPLSLPNGLFTRDGRAIYDQVLYVAMSGPNKIFAVRYHTQYDYATSHSRLYTDAVELSFLPSHPINSAVQRCLDPIRAQFMSFGHLFQTPMLTALILDYVGNESTDALRIAYCSVRSLLKNRTESLARIGSTLPHFSLNDHAAGRI